MIPLMHDDRDDDTYDVVGDEDEYSNLIDIKEKRNDAISKK